MRDTYTLFVTPYTALRREAMKAKLTITVERDLIPKAKRYARERGVSLSQLIESALREATAQSEGSFSKRWRGKLQPAGGADPRRAALSEKYL